MARAREFDPARLDIDAFIDAGATLSGETALADLPRLAATVLPDADGRSLARWQAVGERLRGADRTWQRHLRLSLRCPVAQTCQRCLEPVHTELVVERALRFVDSEADAERLDLESEIDVLASSRRFDLPGLIEDELLLALPAVPRHDDCANPWLAHHTVAAADPADTRSESADGVEPQRPNPFSILRRPQGSGS
jgi:uncharacterized protein